MVPIFPTRLARHRVIGAALTCAFTTGFPFNTTIIYLPQRFQIVNGETPVNAGIKILPLLLIENANFEALPTVLFSALGSGIGGALMNKKNVAFYVLVASNVLEILGTGLLSSLPVFPEVPPEIYVYQAILGLGFGMSVVSLMVTTRLEVTVEDEAVSQGAVTQVRVLGGVIGLAITTTVLIASLESDLSGILSPDQLNSFLQSTGSISGFSTLQTAMTRLMYGKAFNLQMKIIMAFSIASLCISLFTFRKHPLSLQDWAKKKEDYLVMKNLRNVDHREEADDKEESARAKEGDVQVKAEEARGDAV
ncbi:hypothetical protein MMC18_005337 [Xylographa bjoerkii]|nr:hypothetical protein [Xylographa bjoerkii]